MDRSLDDSIRERNMRQRGNNNRSRGSRDRRPPRDGVQKRGGNDDTFTKRSVTPFRGASLDTIMSGISADGTSSSTQFWQHDRYTDDPTQASKRASPPRFNENNSRLPSRDTGGFKIRIDNLSDDILEDQLRARFVEYGLVREARIIFDKYDRSTGVAYVSYNTRQEAENAVADTNGSKSGGREVRVKLITPAPGTFPNDRLHTSNQSRRSLADRISRDEPLEGSGSRRSGPTLAERADRNDSSRLGVDSYRPGRNDRSPIRSDRGGAGRGGPRRPGERRGGGSRRNDRPRKTLADLDQEMEDYFADSQDVEGNAGGAVTNGGTATGGAEDAMELEVI